MKRTVASLNADWLYLPQDRSEGARVDCDERRLGFVPVCLPHTNVELPYNNFSEQEHCFVSWYRRRLDVPATARGRRVFVDFGAVMIAATVFVNGQQVGEEHKGGYTPFSLDVTDHVEFGKPNVLAVRVDSTERTDIPPFGFVVDYLTFGGIYRDVDLRIVDPVHIKHLFARPGNVLSDRKRLDVTARVVNSTDASETVQGRVRLARADDLRQSITDWISISTSVPAHGEADLHLSLEDLPGIRLWDLDAPNLYVAAVELENGDAVQSRVGFRAAEFRDDGSFCLNDRPLKLRGLNRHQTYPYIGQAAPARLQRRDADVLKHELACNVVRTSHYPQSPHFLDRCDEIGLLVIEEIPGWQHIGDEPWKQLAIRDVEVMIVRDRNRPSIVLWGVRINESKDDHDFYARTNALARKLDPTRQTGGIRFHYDSELLEDVFTMNDFGYDLRPPRHPRYMNTEFAGHMYPTKTFDQEERVRQHALHHAHVFNQIYGMKSAGGTGWCAFDYNTHAVFGSGDRICHHGVMDIFREPKFAAHFYASQEDPAKRVVLEPASYWKMGDKSGGGVEPLVVFANVDEVEVFVGDGSRGRFKPDRDKHGNLPHPPFVITGLGGTWGGDWKPLRLVGYLGGKAVIEKRVSNDGVPRRLIVRADDAEIVADGSDMTRVSLRITDEFGNILPFAMRPVMLTIEGPGVLVGDNPFPMPGGRGAVYVRATRDPGEIVVTARAARLPEQRVTIRSRAI
jgi:beta-galactosidase